MYIDVHIYIYLFVCKYIIYIYVYVYTVALSGSDFLCALFFWQHHLFERTGCASNRSNTDGCGSPGSVRPGTATFSETKKWYQLVGASKLYCNHPGYILDVVTSGCSI